MRDKVTIVIPKLNQGGTAKASIAHAESLSSIGIDVDILVCKETDCQSKAALINNTDITYTFMGLKSFFNLPYLFYCAFKYRNKLKGTIIAMHFDAMLICLLVRLCGGNFSLFGQFHTDLENYVSSQSDLKAFLFKLFLKQSKYFDGLVFLTNDQKNWFSSQSYIKSDSINLFVIPNPLNIDMNPVCSSNKDRLLYAGRLSAEKNVSFILDSYKKYLSLGGDLPLDICGDGPLLDKLKQQAVSLNLLDKVNFCGYTAEISTYFSRSKVLILASYVEGFPLVLLEGLNYRTNILTSNCSSACLEMFNIEEFDSGCDFIGNNFSIVDIREDNAIDRFAWQLYRLSKQPNIPDESARLLLSKYSKVVIGEKWKELTQVSQT